MHTQSMPHLLGPHNPKNTTFLTLKKKKKKTLFIGLLSIYNLELFHKIRKEKEYMTKKRLDDINCKMKISYVTNNYVQNSLTEQI